MPTSFRDGKFRAKLERLIRAGQRSLGELTRDIKWEIKEKPYSVTFYDYTIYQDAIERYSIAEHRDIPDSRWVQGFGDERTIMQDRGSAVVAIIDVFKHMAENQVREAILNENEVMDLEEGERLAADYFEQQRSPQT
jgi:hypothetical protein